ncbi:uncharacterized protein L969DRAFT_619542 [Mixia osmundae IAM 14324]|uniref:Actin-related protein 2/3 complex subunit n=1 Tax=Mixia osmundae (strain CBS 9802 / IAM 14324 / JCM 22182 / KY 12970) TaxID=764103 RepID=G7E9M4_MIXOS|nr:uncharacterized protein L969DRAFT_619542 [Mixia osmundae IAM 14324]KEI39973.1 hypothetical protein L969DRAFT_619542 [Mixia osmundae IAM 14324]GAA99343.1 hypothetical protein E5Q_06038 [Mixia osmundae IAM 14324]
MAPESHQFATTALTDHAFNADGSQVAICPNSNIVEVHTKTGTTWSQAHTLNEHDKLVTSIDWAPKTNRIVTCSQDRNAYVWNLSPEGVWKPTLVLLNINRSATCVRWSPNEQKFAVASGARAVAICSYGDESDWWISKQLKKPLRSTVLSLDWHPNSVLLATGSADAKARVFSAYLRETDEKPAPSVWGTKLPFNTLCGEFSSPAGGWVHGVAFSPSGDALAFASHDSTITIVYPAGEGLPPTAKFTVRVPSLPYLTLTFLDESRIAAAGHDCEPVLFESDQHSGWHFSRTIDDPSARSSGLSASTGAPRTGGVGRLKGNEAFSRFSAADSRGVSVVYPNADSPPATPASGMSRTATGSTERTTVHQNTITSLRPYLKQEGHDVTRVSTTGVDGRLVIWNTPSLSSGLSKMTI